MITRKGKLCVHRTFFLSKEEDEMLKYLSKRYGNLNLSKTIRKIIKEDYREFSHQEKPTPDIHKGDIAA